jgi:hypothetical protein
MTEPTAIVPEKGIRPGFNDTGVTIATRLFVASVAGDPNEVALPGAGARAHGVTMEAIKDQERGDVQIEGRAIVTASAAITKGANVASIATGRARLAVSNDVVAGVAQSDAGADGDFLEVELAGVGGGHIVP